MRDATNGEYPKYAIWENVPGAFSSNKGEDFKCVLEAFCGVKEEGVSIPRLAGRKWNHAGEIVGDGFSVAWRQLDAQYWGVPQRRKRIYLVADFRDGRAGEILFERESLRGNSAAGRATGQGATEDAAGSARRSCGVECLNPWDCQSKRIYQPDGIYPTLPAMDCGGANNQAIIYEAMCFKPGQGAKARSLGESKKVTPTLGSEAGGNSVPSVCYPQVAQTLTAEADASPCVDRGQNVVCYDARWNGDHENRVTDYTAAMVYRNPKIGEYTADVTTSTMAARDFKSPRDLVVGRLPVYGVDYRNAVLDEEKTHTLQAKASGGQSLNCTPSVLISGKPPRKYIIRRLTSLECCRLQGFPDGWGVPDYKENMTDEELAFWQKVRDTYAIANNKQPKQYTRGTMIKWYNKLHSDSSEYKMWGNGICLNCAYSVLHGIIDMEN